MTKKEFNKLKQWNFHKKIIQGSICAYPSAIKYLKVISSYNEEHIKKYKEFIIYPNENGFTINENSISCKTFKFKGEVSERINIPYNHIKKIRLYDYNY